MMSQSTGRKLKLRSNSHKALAKKANVNKLFILESDFGLLNILLWEDDKLKTSSSRSGGSNQGRGRS
jgi:hypothetical protein